MLAHARPTAVLTLAATLAVVVTAAPSGGSGQPLPDLRQLVPYSVGVQQASKTRSGRPQERLVFGSTVVNLGPGPFVIEGRRASRRHATMVASQVLVGPGGSATRVRGVGRLRYVRSPDHAHWHLLRLEVYELRRAGSGTLVAPDRKTGFCPGDRYEVSRLPRGWTGRLGRLRNDEDRGRDEPGRLALLESISPGWADNYQRNLEGQFIDITGVPDGRYMLVHRTNVGRRLREADYGNDAASVLLELRRTSPRRRQVSVLKRCPDRPRCR